SVFGAACGALCEPAGLSFFSGDDGSVSRSFGTLKLPSELIRVPGGASMAVWLKGSTKNICCRGKKIQATTNPNPRNTACDITVSIHFSHSGGPTSDESPSSALSSHSS